MFFRSRTSSTDRIIDAFSLPLTAREQSDIRHDVPPEREGYEYFLRGNQFSLDSKQWASARDLYLRCVQDDPCYAPAWARLGESTM